MSTFTPSINDDTVKAIQADIEKATPTTSKDKQGRKVKKYTVSSATFDKHMKDAGFDKDTVVTFSQTISNFLATNTKVAMEQLATDIGEDPEIHKVELNCSRNSFGKLGVDVTGKVEKSFPKRDGANKIVQEDGKNVMETKVIYGKIGCTVAPKAKIDRGQYAKEIKALETLIK